jgi:hypothetical protein
MTSVNVPPRSIAKFQALATPPSSRWQPIAQSE